MYSPQKFYPKKPMRSFRDLEVYTRTLECAVTVASGVRISIPDFSELPGMVNCALSIPLWIAEAHSTRFADRKGSIALLERAMVGCNKMVVYLEEAIGIHGCPSADIKQALSTKSQKDKKDGASKTGAISGTGTLNFDVANDLIKKYLDVRGKIFRLEKSWQKWDTSKSVV